jgi:aldose 1-epimerase
VIFINASRFLPIDPRIIPTGQLAPVEGTPMDFRTPTPFGARITADYEQLKLANGYDHHWVLDKKTPNELSLAGSAWERVSGRFMEVYSTEPGMQVHTGNNLEGKDPRDVGKGATFIFRSGFNMEPSRFPDSPNKPNFPTTVIRAGEWFSGRTVYKFSVK